MERVKTTTSKRKHWMSMFLDGHLLLAKMNLTQQAYKVLHAMLSHGDYSNILQVTQEQIAVDLNITQPEVSRAIKLLLTEKALRLVSKDGRCNKYEFNPELGFRGEHVMGFIKAIRHKQKEENDLWLAQLDKKTGELVDYERM